MKRSATANWKGSGKEGKGTVTADSGVLKVHQYRSKHVLKKCRVQILKNW